MALWRSAGTPRYRHRLDPYERWPARGRPTGASPTALWRSRDCEPPMTRHDLACRGLQSQPAPWLLGLLLSATPPLIGFGFQPSPHHGRGPQGPLAMEGIGTGGTALHHKVQQPGPTDAPSTTNPPQREALASQAFHQRTRRFRNA